MAMQYRVWVREAEWTHREREGIDHLRDRLTVASRRETSVEERTRRASRQSPCQGDMHRLTDLIKQAQRPGGHPDTHSCSDKSGERN